MELADWMALRNSRNIVLTTRTGIRNGYQALRKKIWESYGVNVVISTADITTEEGVKQLLNEANQLGPVSTIFNLAVVSKLHYITYLFYSFFLNNQVSLTSIFVLKNR
jgi:fatty acid synthase